MPPPRRAVGGQGRSSPRLSRGRPGRLLQPRVARSRIGTQGSAKDEPIPRRARVPDSVTSVAVGERSAQQPLRRLCILARRACSDARRVTHASVRPSPCHPIITRDTRLSMFASARAHDVSPRPAGPASARRRHQWHGRSIGPCRAARAYAPPSKARICILGEMRRKVMETRSVEQAGTQCLATSAPLPLRTSTEPLGSGRRKGASNSQAVTGGYRRLQAVSPWGAAGGRARRTLRRLQAVTGGYRRFHLGERQAEGRVKLALVHDGNVLAEEDRLQPRGAVTRGGHAAVTRWGLREGYATVA